MEIGSDLRSSELTSSNYFLQTDRQKVMHMSPPCSGTGGLKKDAHKLHGYIVYLSNALQFSANYHVGEETFLEEVNKIKYRLQ